MNSFQSAAIILSYRNFGEKDRFITIFTKDSGKLSVLAKGVRNVPSRRAAHLEPFNYSTLNIHETSSGNLIITQASTIKDFANLKKDIKKIGLGFYACELVSRLTQEYQEHKEVFDRLLFFLENLDTRKLPHKKDYEEIISNFQKDILKALGFGSGELSKHSKLRYYIEELLEGNLKTPGFLDKIS